MPHLQNITDPELLSSLPRVPHRAHKKSTTGCKACKLRKVKCDEKRPVCGKCTTHFSNLTACDYGDSIPKAEAKPKRLNVLAPSPKPLYLGGTSLTCQNSRASGSLRSLPCLSAAGAADKEVTYGDCGCPCHEAQYTHLMIDTLLGTCRICGNRPQIGKDITKCSPIISDSILSSGSIDPFSILPAKSSPRVHALAYHWNNTLALFPTKINSQYCTNPTWLAQAVNNETFFNATLYVSSVHEAGLRGKRGTPESLYYKAQTIKLLNKSLRDPDLAAADETLAAVLLLSHVVSLIGDPGEAEIHLKGLRQMMELRGGIKQYTLDGVFLHMLCIVNHLTAVITESPSIISPSGIPYRPSQIDFCDHISTFPYTPSPAETSPLLKPFAIATGFHPTVVDLLHDLEYLYFVVDAFTSKFIPEFRNEFEEIVKSIEVVQKVVSETEREWFLKRLRRWGEGEVMQRRSYKKGPEY